MVSDRCKQVVKSELELLGLDFRFKYSGEVEILQSVSVEKLNQLNAALTKWGLSVTFDHKTILIEKIKLVIIDLIHYSDEMLKINFSDYLSEKLNHDYTYLANIFSKSQEITIEHFLISQKIERVKELLLYDELSISEIAYKMQYSSVGHLSNQFRKMTGLTPSHYKKLRLKKRIPIENV